MRASAERVPFGFAKLGQEVRGASSEKVLPPSRDSYTPVIVAARMWLAFTAVRA